MKCLVLGGGGFLGSNLCRALLVHGHEVSVFERRQPEWGSLPLREGEVKWFEGDFSDAREVELAVEGMDVVFHLVSTTLPKTSNLNPAFDVESNVVGTIGLLEACLKHGVNRVLFASSGGTIYGVPGTTPIPETHVTEPECSYGIGKLAIEKYLHLYRHLHGLDYRVLRLANPYGEGQRPGGAQGAVTVFLNKALRGETVEIWGDGSVVRDYIYVHDVSEAFLKALAHTGEVRIFNVGSGIGHSLNEILDTIEALLGNPVARSYTPARAFDVPVNVLDIRRARETLGWSPRTDLMEGMRQTLEWLRDEGGVPGSGQR